ncbi:hypothetical protein [Natrinema soli]|nr:hypothetical protein [Natrinema soli]
METPQFYIRLEEWAQAMSRSGFALLVGVGSAVGLLVVSPIFNDIGILNAVSLGIMMAVVYYAFDPLNKG